MTIKEIMSCITDEAPLFWQEDYDNAGLQIGNENAETRKALITLDVTEEVVAEAVAKGCDLIISHHPLLFHGLKQITPQTAIERIVIEAIRNRIAIVSMHTNLDNYYRGVSFMLAEMIGLKNLELLQPNVLDPEHCGAGMVGELEHPISETAFLQKVADCLITPCLRHSALTGRPVKKVAVCGGSGSPFLPDALNHHVDVYLTADIKYHDFFAPNDILLVDGGHFETEQFTKYLIRNMIHKKFPNFAAEITDTDTNAVHYFCNY